MANLQEEMWLHVGLLCRTKLGSGHDRIRGRLARRRQNRGRERHKAPRSVGQVHDLVYVSNESNGGRHVFKPTELRAVWLNSSPNLSHARMPSMIIRRGWAHEAAELRTSSLTSGLSTQRVAGDRHKTYPAEHGHAFRASVIAHLPGTVRMRTTRRTPTARSSLGYLEPIEART